MKKFLITVLLLISPNLVFAADCHVDGKLQDQKCTPGAIIPEATAKDVCVHGYTDKVRNVPQSLKRRVFAQYGITKDFGLYEVDHLISLELGGSNDIKNLWPESYANPEGARVKDQIENYLHRQVCLGNITLGVAQDAIRHDWVKVYEGIHLPIKNKVAQ